ncbi:hypothetical protein FQN50_002657 [Emmonsiellopsis sp. PD_5]|nr:hypothetical protein FQN50_002657 [Emmonsiellopsis sp. PD_5]
MSTSVTIELPAREQPVLSAVLEEREIEQQSFAPGATAPIAHVKQKWNEPAINKWRILVTFVSFAIVGASDGVYGIRADFNLSTTVVSLIFMTPFAGYALATIAVNKVHMTFGQRGIAIIGPLCHFVPFLIMAIRPPYPVYLVAYAIVGFGNGLIDAAWNAWVGDMVNANALMGFLHAFYGLGATVSPTIATGMINSGLDWWLFYYTLVGGSALELVGNVAMFWQENAERFRNNNRKTPGSAGDKRTTEAVKNRVTWVTALFLFVYMGVEVSIGGWIVEFMMQVRDGDALESGFIPTGFWAGERLAITIYLVISIGLELVFWLVPKFVVSAIAVSLIGFFTGPLFPGAIVVAAKLLPKHLHTPGIGIASAFAGGGGAILPFLAGAIAQPHGVQSLQPFVLAMLVAITVLWMLLPRKPRHAHEG